MKFMLNGAPTLGTMDGANVEIVDEVGKENAFIFGLSADEVINYENNGGYDPRVIYNTDDEIRQVLTELVNGTFSSDTELFRDLYNSLLNQNGGERADQYFILADFRSYAAAQMAAVTGVPQSTWESIIARESNGDYTVASSSGASGFFQTMPGWGSTATVEDQIQSALNAYNAQGLSAWNY